MLRTPRRTTSATLAAASLLLFAAACADAPTSATATKRASNETRFSYGPTPAGVPCSKEHSGYSRGVHAVRGKLTAQSPTNCDALTGTSPIRVKFQYVFDTVVPTDTTNVARPIQYIYFTVVSTSGAVTNTLMTSASRADWTTYTVDTTFTPTSTMERAIISVGHGELPATGGSADDHREFVYHVWRAIPQPVLSAPPPGSTVTLSWTQNHHFLVHLLERSCSGGAYATVATVMEPYTTSHSRTDTPPSSVCSYRVRAYMDHAAYADIGANILTDSSYPVDMVWTESNVVTVSPPPVHITSSSPLPSASAGIAYSYTFTAADGVPPYSWSATSSLPAGLTLSSAGVLSGAPSAAGDYSFGVKVTSTGSTDTRTFALHVAPSLSVAIFGPSSMRPSKTCTWEAEVSGGSGSYTYKWYRNNSLVGTDQTYTFTSTSTSFTLRLDATSSDGLVGTNSRTVTVSSSASAFCISA